MKKYLILAMLIASSFSYGQVLAKDSSYSATDTTVWVAVGGGNQVLVFVADDSCNVTLDLDYAESPNKTTNFQTYRVADSTNSVVATGMFKGYLLRAGATNNMPGAGAARLRVTKIVGNGKNGTSSPLYDAYIKQY
jgi:hypothetical protein